MRFKRTVLADGRQETVTVITLSFVAPQIKIILLRSPGRAAERAEGAYPGRAAERTLPILIRESRYIKYLFMNVPKIGPNDTPIEVSECPDHPLPNL